MKKERREKGRKGEEYGKKEEERRLKKERTLLTG